MAPDTDFQKNRRLPSLSWNARFSLTWSILAVNTIALALLAGGVFYIDSYRRRVIDERLYQSARRMELVREAIAYVPRARATSASASMAPTARSNSTARDRVDRVMNWSIRRKNRSSAISPVSWMRRSTQSCAPDPFRHSRNQNVTSPMPGRRSRSHRQTGSLMQARNRRPIVRL